VPVRVKEEHLEDLWGRAAFCIFCSAGGPPVTREGAALPAKAGMIRVPEAVWRGDSVVEGDGPFRVGGRFHPIGESFDGLTWGPKPRVVKDMIDGRLREVGNCLIRGGSDC
jgi:hypothetical protein